MNNENAKIHSVPMEIIEAMQDDIRGSKGQRFAREFYDVIDNKTLNVLAEKLDELLKTEFEIFKQLLSQAIKERDEALQKIEEEKVKSFQDGKSAQCILELRGRDSFIQEKKKEMYATMNAIRDTIIKTGFFEDENSTLGLVEGLSDLAVQRVEDVKELREKIDSLMTERAKQTDQIFEQHVATVKERNGNWMDEIGCCKVCNGEIPQGHTENCDIYKNEKEIRTLRLMLKGVTSGEKPQDNWDDICKLKQEIIQIKEKLTRITTERNSHVFNALESTALAHKRKADISIMKEIITDFKDQLKQCKEAFNRHGWDTGQLDGILAQHESYDIEKA